MAPYEAQYMARAHESQSFLVQANVGATKSYTDTATGNGVLLDEQGGSHGNSLVVGPKGNILIKVSMLHTRAHAYARARTIGTAASSSRYLHAHAHARHQHQHHARRQWA